MNKTTVSTTVSDVLKSCTLTDAVSMEQKNVVKNVLNSSTLLQKTSEKGCYGEVASDLYVKNAGCRSLLQTPCCSLDSPGHHGLDGLYIYRNVLIITEVKYGKGRLINTKSGRQMSDRWVDPRLSKTPYTINSRLDKAVSGSAKAIIDSLQKGNLILLKLLIHISPKNDISVHLLDGDGRIFCRNIDL